MDIQEWDIDLSDAASLDFYDIITVSLDNGTEIPIWAKDSDHRIGEAAPDSSKLVFVSQRPISIERVLSLQDSFRDRKLKGWYHKIR